MFRNSAMTKAVAPITGGASTAPVEAQASMAPAMAGLKPVFFMAGIVLVPVVSTLEITLPLMEPSNPEEKMATFAAPPRYVPHSAKARLMKNAPAPLYWSAVPKTRKPITSSAKARIGMPSTLSREKMWNDAASSRLTDGACSGAGISTENSGNSENTPMMISSAMPPARRSASSTSSQLATAPQTIQRGATSGALYSQPLPAESRAVQAHNRASPVAAANSTRSYQGTWSSWRPTRAGYRMKASGSSTARISQKYSLSSSVTSAKKRSVNCWLKHSAIDTTVQVSSNQRQPGDNWRVRAGLLPASPSSSATAWVVAGAGGSMAGFIPRTPGPCRP